MPGKRLRWVYTVVVPGKMLVLVLVLLVLLFVVNVNARHRRQGFVVGVVVVIVGQVVHCGSDDGGVGVVEWGTAGGGGGGGGGGGVVAVVAVVCVGVGVGAVVAVAGQRRGSLGRFGLVHIGLSSAVGGIE